MSSCEISFNQKTIACQLINLLCCECLDNDYYVELFLYTKIKLNKMHFGQDRIDVEMIYRHEQRLFSGVISTLARHDNYYQITLMPFFYLLKSSFNQRTFVRQTVLQITQQVLKQHQQVIIDYKKLNKHYLPIIYEVQYTESDYDFLKRIWSENGVSYYYHGAEIVLYDDISGYKSYSEKMTGVTLWRRQARYGIEKLQILYDGAHIVNVRQPQYQLTSSQEIVSQHSPYDINQKLGSDLERAVQQTEENFILSDHCGLSVGISFLYQKHFVVSEIYHFLYFDRGQMCYSNQLYCHLVTHMLPLPMYAIPAQEKQLQANVSAIEAGRLLRAAITYQWDQTKGISPAFPVRQCWSGNGYGAQFMPQLHQEVFVAYVNGDMRYPVIMGKKHQSTQALFIGTQAHYLKISQDGIFFKTEGFYQVRSSQVVLLKSYDNIHFAVKGKAVSIFQSANTLKLVGDATIEFIVGDSFLKIEAGKVTINSAMIELNPER